MTVEPEPTRLPSVDALVRAGNPERLGLSHAATVQVARALLDRYRRSGTTPAFGATTEALRETCQRLSQRRLRRAINATGIVLHTNLGRAPLEASLGDEAWGYGDVELDLETGDRGSRAARVEELGVALWEVPAVAVANNNAAALVLAVRAAAPGGTVVVSRGEAVQIGGGFRVPAIVEASGARLHEVGTANITTIADYAEALERIGRGAVLLRVHRSNFSLEGHVASPSDLGLGALARERDVPFVIDQGSGAGEPFRRLVREVHGAVLPEPTIEKLRKDGATLVTFSGDKLLGGPQAGFVAGELALVARAKRDPLARAFRLDKVRLAALERVLGEWLRPRPALPFLERLRVPGSVLLARAEQLATVLVANGIEARATASSVPLGGGATPAWELPSAAIVVRGERGERAFRRLLAQRPAVVARRDRGHLVFDLRSVAPEEDTILAGAILEAFA